MSEMKDLSKLVKETVAEDARKLWATLDRRPTQEEIRDHFWVGLDGRASCLVCSCRPLSGSWTDYNGQMRCCLCGCTYQVLGNHLRDEYLKEICLAKESVAKEYCDCFDHFPLLRDYWRETNKPIPYGMYLMEPDKIPISVREGFWRWMAYNANRYKDEYADIFNWDAIIEAYGAKNYAHAGEGI